MTPTNDKVIVKVDMAQKNSLTIGGITILAALKYETNYREKSPVIAQVVEGNEHLPAGAFLLCHHNHFYSGSPYLLYDDLFSIPANHTIFAIIDAEGALTPVYGNILADKVPVATPLPVPVEFREFYKDRGIVLDGGWTKFAPGDLVFTRPSAIYEIVYHQGGTEKRICKINSEMICALLKKK